MDKTPTRVYWDANAWIAYIRKEMPSATNSVKDRRFELCQQVIRRAEALDIEIVTSAFTLAEVCKRRTEAHVPAVNLQSFFDQPYIFLVNVDKVVGQKAQYLQLSGFGGLKPPDAIHIATALVANVPVMHTFDAGLLGLNKLVTLNDGNQLVVVKPMGEVPLPGLLEKMQGE